MTYMAVALLFSIIEDRTNTNHQSHQLKRLFVDLVKKEQLSLYSEYGLLCDDNNKTIQRESSFPNAMPHSILCKLKTASSPQALKQEEDRINTLLAKYSMELHLEHLVNKHPNRTEPRTSTADENQLAHLKLKAIKRIHRKDNRIVINQKENSTINLENYCNVTSQDTIQATNSAQHVAHNTNRSRELDMQGHLTLRHDPFPTPPLSVRMNIRNLTLINENQDDNAPGLPPLRLPSPNQQSQIVNEQVLRSWWFTNNIPQEVDRNFFIAQSRSFREANRNAILKNSSACHEVSRTTVTPKGFTKYFKDLNIMSSICCDCETSLVDLKPWFVRACGHVYCHQCIDNTGRCPAQHCKCKEPRFLELFI